MAQQTHGSSINLDSLPDEMLDRIVELIIAQDRSRAETLARTSRRPQAKVYRALYPVLTVQSTNLGLLARLRRPQYQFLKEIVFEHELPRYDCNECSTLVPCSAVEILSKKFRFMLKEFFAAIAIYDPRYWAHARVTLDLFCPSDHQHWRIRHRSRIANSEARAQIGNIKSELDIFATIVDIGHRFARLRSPPDVNSLLRPFTMTSQPHPSELHSLESQVRIDPALIQELYISRQMCRQIDPTTMIFILKCMPMLKQLHYEKWKTPGDKLDLCLEMLDAALLLPCLQSLIIYEEHCPRLSQALEMQRSRSSTGAPNDGPKVVPVSRALPPVPQMAISASQSIRELSVSKYVDGYIFIKNLEDTKDCWSALHMLTLTMKDFTRDPSSRQLISQIITSSALLLPNLPSLDTMRLYNDSLDNACILTCINSGATASERRPTVTWKSAWDFTFSDEEKQHWIDATAARRGKSLMPAFVKHPLHVRPSATHTQVLNSLGVAWTVMSYRSRVVKEYEDGMIKQQVAMPESSQEDS